MSIIRPTFLRATTKEMTREIHDKELKCYIRKYLTPKKVVKEEQGKKNKQT